MGAATEPASPPFSSPRLRRQHSLASAIASRCCSVLCCYDCDNFFTQLPAPSVSSRDFTAPAAHNSSLQQRAQTPAAWHDWRLLGSRRSKIALPAVGHDEAESVLSDGSVYAKPGRWRVFLRKLRAETRRMNCGKPSPPGYHYDAFSYAMNFDDGSWQQQQSLYRSPSPAFMESLPLPSGASSVS